MARHRSSWVRVWATATDACAAITRAFSTSVSSNVRGSREYRFNEPSFVSANRCTDIDDPIPSRCASGAQGELLFDDGDTVTVKKADGTTQKFKCSDGTWVVALTTNPAPSFDFDFKAAFTATEEEVSQACDDIKGVPTSGATGYGCYKPRTSVLVLCAPNGACTGFSPLPIHAKTLRGFLGVGITQVEPDTGGTGGDKGGAPPPSPPPPSGGPIIF